MLLYKQSGYGLGLTFNDTAGNCWYILDAQPVGPDTIAWGGNVWETCTQCNADNDNCTMVTITSCCADVGGITSLESLGGGVAIGYNFVDQFGMCWEVVSNAIDGEVAYNFINVASIYSTSGSDCAACVGDNACPTFVYYRFKNCCTGEIKYVYDVFGSYQAGYSYLLITSLDGGNEPDCWSVLDWNITGTATLTVSIGIDMYSTCDKCVNAGLNNECHSYYTAISCCVGVPSAVVYLPDYIHNNGYSFSDTSNKCWTTLAPTVGPATITWSGADYGDCSSCITDGNPC
jgi:hypothetical protein